ncbi:YcbK family protein [Rhizobium leguminosarum]|nr:D-Ala-D-Ala carboxypeptidase family metallohydrolase [Rhizobium ruizarguesonis]MBY5849850.1 YcbK family protein [Rhizobium leguminosarum]MBY5888015.1 YcbK family protein [Rhizobium leguminosarum]QSZ02993.1 YcbK family protein [Rhizobium ruizarguesonis]
MRNMQMMPVTGALLIATSVLALTGCASDKKALDSAAAVPAQAAAPQLATAAPASPAPRSVYTDPRLVNVSGAQAAPQVVAQNPNAAAPPADPATAAPANIGGLVLQSTRINAQAMSIFSDHQPAPQNNSTSTVIQPQAYVPVEGAAPARSSVYSQPPVPTQPAEPVLPQQSSQNNSTQLAPVQTASLATGSIPTSTMNALYSAPKQNLLGSLSGLLHKAALPGMTRIAPNGLHLQNDKVEVGCFKPALLKVIKTVENHFGRPVIVTSGYRDEEHNRLVGGADESMHKSCEAADIQIDGVAKWDIAAYIRSLPDRGGVGTYCHTDSVHLDTGKTRDWNWGCGGKRAPMTTARAI